MAIRKLYGTLGSPDTIRALASIFEHELDFEFIPIDLNAGEHKTESFLSLSPFGLVPVYQDDGLTLFVYEVPKLQGIAATWIDVEDHQFSPPAEKLRQELVDKAKKGLPMDKEVVAEAEAKLIKVLDVYEERLTHSKYLGGDRFTSADLTHLPYLYHLMGTPVKQLFEERPNVSTWCKDILSRPCWSRVVEMVEKDKV
ncbi:glutathione s-transferase [Quercus suber]|uniref:glutathione transferase n=1 Tax=Quercus suber TaxID=58331 RepID=A0AAW0IUZ9_QUESU